MSNLKHAKTMKSESPKSDFIPYSHHVTPTIVATKSAEYLSVFRLTGRSHISASQEDVTLWRRDLNNLLRGIGNEHFSMWSHIVRREVFEYPEAEYKNVFCDQLHREYTELFNNTTPMVNELYVTVVYRPVSDKVLSFFGAMEKDSPELKAERQADAIKELDDINKRLGASLKSYGAELLGIYRANTAGEIVDDDAPGGAYFSATAEFLDFLVNGEFRRVPVSRNRICDVIGGRGRVFFSEWGEVGQIRGDRRDRYFGIREFFEYPDETEPGQLNNLLELPFEFIITHSFACISRPAAKGYLTRHKKNLVDAKDVAVNQVEEIDDALEGIVAGKFVMGEHHGTVTVFAETGKQVLVQLAEVASELSDRGVLDRRVDLAVEAAYWAQLPGNFRYRPRPAIITSLNFLSFSPFHNFLSGKAKGNPWGPAVTILKTVSGTPLYFNYHASHLDVDDTDKKMLGNTMFTGASGEGKTVGVTFTVAQAQKFGNAVVAFDKDRGMEVVIRAMGGRYLPLQMGESSGFNPFQIPATPSNIAFLKRFVRTLAGMSGEINHSDSNEIDDAVNTIMAPSFKKELRRLSVLIQSLPHSHFEAADRPSVHSRLLKWCEGGEYGWMFDNPTDSLDITTHDVYGFDVTEFLEHAEIRGPVMMYLIYRTEQMIDGRRFMYVFDEFWKPLEDPYFQDLVKNKQKTIRKQNGICVFSTQEADDITDSPIAKTLVSQCATFVFFPNPGADRKLHKDVFKLTDAEFDILESLPSKSRQFLIKQGENCAVGILNLAGLDEILSVLSPEPETSKISEQCVAEFGEDPAVWLPHFYNRARAYLEKARKTK